MKTRTCHGFAAALLAILFVLTGAFVSLASTVCGALEPISGTTISGWAVDAANPDKSVSVVLYVYTDGSSEAKELAKVTADQYRKNLNETMGNGSHSFSYTADWSSMEGTSFRVEAFAETETGPVQLPGSAAYEKPASKSSKSEGNGPAGSETSVESTASVTGSRGDYLGTFHTTAYCGCSICCPTGSGLTYSGTVPKENHTISADISRFPIGTRLMIGDTIYTVEDTGTGIVGDRLDIYFDNHQAALNYGRQTVDVYAVK